MSRAELNALLRAVAGKDRGAFDQLYQLTSAKLFGVCLRILQDRGQSEEVAQEVFVKIWTSAASYKEMEYSPMTWLISIARNTAIDAVRRKRTIAVDLDEALDVKDLGPTPDAALEFKQSKNQIDYCLDQLEPQRRHAVRQAYLEGYSYQEIATALDRPINTVRTWLRRSLIDLRGCMSGALSVSGSASVASTGPRS